MLPNDRGDRYLTEYANARISMRYKVSPSGLLRTTKEAAIMVMAHEIHKWRYVMHMFSVDVAR